MGRFICDICNKEFNSLDDYITHLQGHKVQEDKLEKERKELSEKRQKALIEIKNDAAALQKKVKEFNDTYKGYVVDFKFSINNPTILPNKEKKTSNLENILFNALENTPEAKDDTFKSFMNRVDNNIDKSKLSENETKEYNSLKSMVEFLDKLF